MHTFKVNKVKKTYDVTFEEKDKWEDEIYGVKGDETQLLHDKDYPESVTTLRSYKSEDGNIYTQLCSISAHQHEIRPYTCCLAWNFLKQFRRNKEGKIVII